jgi:Zn-dependent M16 (insulinase) family peptidase
LLYFTFSNVPVEKIDLIHPKLKKLLENVAGGGEKFDMVRIKTILEKQILEAINSLESNPHDDIAFHVIGDVLYGYTDEDFKSRLNEKDCYTMLIGKDEQFWVDLIKQYLVEGKYIVVRAIPSIEEASKVAKDKLERVEQLRLDLGEEGLRTKEEELMKAMEKNEQPPPKEILTEINVPSTKGIKFHPLTIHRSGGLDGGPPGLSLNELPVFAEAYDLHSNFVYVSLHIQNVMF